MRRVKGNSPSLDETLKLLGRVRLGTSPNQRPNSDLLRTVSHYVTTQVTLQVK